MRIAYVTGARIPSVAANSVQSIRMCEAFSSLGHDVTLYARQGDEPRPDLERRFGIEAPVELVGFPQRGPRGLHTIVLLARMLREVGRRNPDAVFARDVFAATLLARKGRPLIYEAHGIPAAGSIHDRALRLLTRRPGLLRIIAITQALKEMLLARYAWLPDEAILVLPNGASDPLLHSAGRPPLPPSSRLRVGHVGHLYQGRGVEWMLAAARRLPDLEFHLIGGRQEDVTRWTDAGLPVNVHLHGHVPHSQLGAYYRQLDILLAPYGSKVLDAQGNDSAAFASPMKLFEYMAAGKAIVSTALPGVREVMRNGETGLLVAAGDEQGFLDAIRTLAGNAGLRQRLGDAARRTYLQKHSWRARAEAILNLYAEFPADRRKGHREPRRGGAP